MRKVIAFAAVCCLAATASADDRWPTLKSTSSKVIWTAPTTQPDKPSPAMCSRPVLSPDGERLAVFVSEPGGSRLLLLSADDGKELISWTTTDPKASCSQIRFAQRGTVVVAVVQHAPNPAGKATRGLVWLTDVHPIESATFDDAGSPIHEFAESPDARELAMVTGTGVAVRPVGPGIKGGEEPRTEVLLTGKGTQEEPAPYRDIAFSPFLPDGSFMVAVGQARPPFTVVGQGPGHVVFLNAREGRHVVLLVTTPYLAISPDGRQVAGAVWTHSPVGIERPGGVMVWDVADLRAGRTAGRWALDPKRFIGGNHTYPGGLFWIDGKLCAVATEIKPEPGEPFRRFGVWQVQPDGQPKRLSLIGPMPKRMWPDPAGRGLVLWRYAGDDAGMFFLDDRTGRCFRFDDKLNTRAWTLSVSPDLKRLAVVQGGQVIVHELEERRAENKGDKPEPAKTRIAEATMPGDRTRATGAVTDDETKVPRGTGKLIDPWVRTDRSIDCRSRDTILAGIIKPDMTDEQKAVAIWRFTLDHTWHFSRADENDNLRLFNVYGYSLCGTLSRMQNWLREGVFPASWVAGGGCSRYGSSQAEREAICRGWLIDSWQRLDGGQKRPGPGNLGHTMGEVYYDGHWHFLDPHGGFYVYTADGGRIAGYDDLQIDPTLVSDPVRTSDPFMPYDGGRPLFYYRFSGSGGRGTPDPDAKPAEPRRPAPETSMAVALRPGERLIRSWQPIPQAFKWSSSWKGQWGADYIGAGPHHVPSGWGTWRKYANARLIYEVPLAKPVAARAGLNELDNVRFAEGESPAIHPADPAKPMSFAIPVRSPYVLIRGELTGIANLAPGQRFEAFVRIGRKQELRGELAEVRPTAIRAAFDSRDLNYGHEYDLVVKLSPGRGGIDKLTLETVCQLNPLTLPRLRPGRNTVTITTANPAELATLGPLLVTYAWCETSGEKRHVEKVTESPHSYAIEVGEVESADPRDPSYMQSFELSVPAR